MQDKKLKYETMVFDRLMEVSNAEKLEDLADFLDIKYGTLRGQKARGSIPYSEIVQKCSEKELVYVLKGTELVSKLNNKDISEPLIPFYKSVKPAAGNQIVPEDEDDLIYIGLPRTFIYEELYANPADLFIMRVKGDSMEPTIGENDFVIVKQQARRPYQGVYLLRIGEGLVCKRVEEHPDGLKIISDNPHYENYIVRYGHENLHIFGRVLWYGRML